MVGPAGVPSAAAAIPNGSGAGVRTSSFAAALRNLAKNATANSAKEASTAAAASARGLPVGAANPGKKGTAVTMPTATALPQLPSAPTPSLMDVRKVRNKQ